jgi:hypothetical protein
MFDFKQHYQRLYALGESHSYNAAAFALVAVFILTLISRWP